MAFAAAAVLCFLKPLVGFGADLGPGLLGRLMPWFYGALGAVGAYRLFRKARTPDAWPPYPLELRQTSDGLRPTCPRCDTVDIYRGSIDTDSFFQKCFIARCLTCGLHIVVERPLWKRLAVPLVGMFGELGSDASYIATSNSIGSPIIGVLAVFTGIVLFLITLSEWPESALMAPAPLMLCGLGVYLLITASRLKNRHRGFPLRCRRCGYDVRGVAAPRCPECNASVDLARIQGLLPRPVSQRRFDWSEAEARQAERLRREGVDPAERREETVELLVGPDDGHESNEQPREQQADQHHG